MVKYNWVSNKACTTDGCNNLQNYLWGLGQVNLKTSEVDQYKALAWLFRQTA